MSYNFLISSTNVRGLGSELKRKKVFLWLKQRRFDISFLQETHSVLEEERIWQQQWGFSDSIIFSHGANDARGVAIVLRRGIDLKIDRTWRDAGGRCIMLEVHLKELHVILVNIYSPTSNVDQIHFYRNLRQHLLGFNQAKLPVIIGGDLNVTFDLTLDKQGGQLNYKAAVMREVRCILGDWNLVDSWREMHPGVRQYTWQQPYPLVKCRLDYWLVPSDLMERVKDCSIKHSVATDHKSVSFWIQGPNFCPRGPGLWRLNTMILEDPQYQQLIDETIKEAIDQTMGWESRLKWDFMKMRIRDVSMEYCARKNSRRSKRKRYLEAALEDREGRIHLMSPVELNELEQMKSEYEAILEDDTRRGILRTRARWIAFGERPNKYFLGMEKRNAVRKCISKLVNDKGEEFISPETILREIESAYTRIYAKDSVGLEQVDTWIREISDRDTHKLSEEAKEMLDRPVQEWEFKRAAEAMAVGKAPGRDGLPVEWYRRFWEVIREPYMESVQASLEQGELSETQRQGVISLLPKPGKDQNLLSGWRPITLLNCDYKLLAKVLAARLKKFIPDLVKETQTGFVSGRYIGENIRMVLDIIESMENDRNGEGLLLTLDFESAFDTIGFDFLFAALRYKNFGPVFIQAVQTLYRGASSEAMNNGFISGRIPMGRGIRQGCPISPYLFIIAGDYLATALETSPNVRGITIANHEYLSSQFADDTSLILQDSRAAEAALAIVEEFGRVSGLKLNKGKTECLPLGQHRDQVQVPDGIKRVEKIRILGVWFAYDRHTMRQSNFGDKFSVLAKQVTNWSHRKLTIFGKTLVWNQLLGSQLVYSLMNVPAPAETIRECQLLIRQFLWDGKNPKVRQDVLRQPVGFGGVKAPDVGSTLMSLRLSWMKRLLRDPAALWTRIGFRDLEQVGGLPFLLRCNFSLTALGLDLPCFYADILDAYKWFRESPICEVDTPEVLGNQLVCNNRFVLVGGKSVFHEWMREGPLARVADWFDGTGRPRSYEVLAGLVGGRLRQFRYMQIVSAIPVEWKRMMARAVGLPYQPSEVRPSWANGAKKRYLAANRGEVPAGQTRWCQIYPDMKEWSWPRIWTLSQQLGLTNKLRFFQYKILHRILAAPSKLYLWKQQDSPECYLCGADMDTIEHMLVGCPRSRVVWVNLFLRFERHEQVILNWTEEQVIFGFFDLPISVDALQRLNTIVTLCKHYVYSQRNASSFTFSEVGFQSVLKRHLLYHWHAAQSLGQITRFEQLWQSYM